MVTSRLLYFGLVALVGAERLFELALSARNAAKARSRGAVEVGAPHFRAMAAFHTLFLVCCVAEVWVLRRSFPGILGIVCFGLVLAAQALRYWAVTSLGDRWNVRILVEPTSPPVTRGPYRCIRHPNYLAVVLEMLALPLVHGAWLTCLVFSAGNAILLWIRIRAEEAALGSSYAFTFAHRPRFIPRLRRS